MIGIVFMSRKWGDAYLPKKHYQPLNTFDAFSYPGFLQCENSFLDSEYGPKLSLG